MLTKHFTLNHLTVTLAAQDILTAPVDVIVNPANGYLQHGGGLAAAILTAAGQQLDEECRQIIHLHGPLQTTEAVITSSGSLAQHTSIRYVIHAVGPRNGEGQEQLKLEQTFMNCLLLAEQYKDEKELDAIAFPAISTGIFGVSKTVCARAFAATLSAYAARHSKQTMTSIWLCVNQNDYSVFDRYIFADK